MNYNLFIFDFDGTLADSADWMIRTFNDIAGTHGLRRVSDSEIDMLRGRSNREIVSYLGVPAWRIPAIATDMRKRVAAAADQIKLFAKVDRLLRTLRDAGVQIAIVSSNSEANVRKILGLENAGYVHHYDCGANLFGKARKLRRVMKRAGVEPHATLCIGDETRDIEAAREVGAACAAVTWGYATVQVLADHKPTLLFGSIEELMEKIGLRVT